MISVFEDRPEALRNHSTDCAFAPVAQWHGGRIQLDPDGMIFAASNPGRHATGDWGLLPIERNGRLI
jgi:hypothetical protein